MLFQAYEDDSDEKRSANMNMGPRTWYQVPRDLRYPPEVNILFCGDFLFLYLRQIIFNGDKNDPHLKF